MTSIPNPRPIVDLAIEELLEELADVGVYPRSYLAASSKTPTIGQSLTIALIDADPPNGVLATSDLTPELGDDATLTFTPDTETAQWFKGGSALDGETSTTLTIASVQSSDAGGYFLKLTNTRTGNVRTIGPVNIRPEAA